ncbi:MAG: hypothetical protein CME65_08280 [Halobacteriovoraceae bacterium]|nr:hypothetical protein [Halobacteriovoraceae bacterium]|tara:strand:+ start:1490 stop:1681 length:192 start_codon:yes stop_codon:yes gene_type:complete
MDKLNLNADLSALELVTIDQQSEKSIDSVKSLNLLNFFQRQTPQALGTVWESMQFNKLSKELI